MIKFCLFYLKERTKLNIFCLFVSISQKKVTHLFVLSCLLVQNYVYWSKIIYYVYWTNIIYYYIMFIGPILYIIILCLLGQYYILLYYVYWANIIYYVYWTNIIYYYIMFGGPILHNIMLLFLLDHLLLCLYYVH